jgi:hypothetical protein
VRKDHDVACRQLDVGPAFETDPRRAIHDEVINQDVRRAGDIEKDLRANLLPGVTIVPAMVIAIEKAQEAGIRYNRQ